MKRTVFFLLLTVTAFCACKKEDSTTVAGDMSFKADGVLKPIKTCQAQYIKSIPNDFSRVLIIGRTDKDEQMILDVMGTANIQPSGVHNRGYYAIPTGGIDTARYIDNTAGTIKIQSLTTDRVTGTFQFTGVNNTGSYAGSKNVTEGSFGCKVTVL